MKATELISRLTSKDAKAACSFTEKILAESQDSDRWYEYFHEFAVLLAHPNSLVRNRAITIIAANAQWDESNQLKSFIDDYLSHVTDDKPITARQCIKSLPKIAAAKPQYIPEILERLRTVNLSQYKDSMRHLIEKDIQEAQRNIEQ